MDKRFSYVYILKTKNVIINILFSSSHRLYQYASVESNCPTRKTFA